MPEHSGWTVMMSNNRPGKKIHAATATASGLLNSFGNFTRTDRSHHHAVDSRLMMCRGHGKTQPSHQDMRQRKNKRTGIMSVCIFRSPSDIALGLEDFRRDSVQDRGRTPGCDDAFIGWSTAPCKGVLHREKYSQLVRMERTEADKEKSVLREGYEKGARCRAPLS